MEDKHLRRIKIRRGSNLQRKQIIFEEGEFIYADDIKKLYVGDLKKYGGNRLSNNNKLILQKQKPENSDVGDILYNKLDKATYIVDVDDSLVKITGSLNDYYSLKKRIQDVEDLLNKLEKECCSTDFALDTDDGMVILADYGDWIKVKDTESSTIICKAPIISDKYLKLQSNKVYNLNILDYNSDSDIIFLNNEIDRDINDIPKNIKIVQSSVNCSSNIKILDVTDNIIKFSVEPLPIGVTLGTGVYIDYNIENDCGYIQQTKAFIGGVVYDNNITIKTTKLNEYKKYIINKSYQINQILNPITNDYIWDDEGWYLFYFDSDVYSDIYYITMADKFPIITNDNSSVKNYSYGPIGPVYDKGMYVFYHPKNTDLNIWNKSDTTNSICSWAVYKIYDTSEHPNSPNRFFKDVDTKPSVNQIKSMLSEIKLTYEKDYTNVFTNTSAPPFLKTF